MELSYLSLLLARLLTAFCLWHKDTSAAPTYGNYQEPENPLVYRPNLRVFPAATSPSIESSGDDSDKVRQINHDKQLQQLSSLTLVAAPNEQNVVTSGSKSLPLLDAVTFPTPNATTTTMTEAAAEASITFAPIETLPEKETSKSLPLEEHLVNQTKSTTSNDMMLSTEESSHAPSPSDHFMQNNAPNPSSSPSPKKDVSAITSTNSMAVNNTTHVTTSPDNKVQLSTTTSPVNPSSSITTTTTSTHRNSTDSAHESRRPKTVLTGRRRKLTDVTSLIISTPPSITVGVDPTPSFKTTATPPIHTKTPVLTRPPPTTNANRPSQNVTILVDKSSSPINLQNIIQILNNVTKIFHSGSGLLSEANRALQVLDKASKDKFGLKKPLFPFPTNDAKTIFKPKTTTTTTTTISTTTTTTTTTTTAKTTTTTRTTTTTPKTTSSQPDYLDYSPFLPPCSFGSLRDTEYSYLDIDLRAPAQIPGVTCRDLPPCSKQLVDLDDPIQLPQIPGVDCLYDYDYLYDNYDYQIDSAESTLNDDPPPLTTASPPVTVAEEPRTRSSSRQGNPLPIVVPSCMELIGSNGDVPVPGSNCDLHLSQVENFIEAMQSMPSDMMVLNSRAMMDEEVAASAKSWNLPSRAFGRPNGLIEGRDFNIALEILSDITV